MKAMADRKLANAIGCIEMIGGGGIHDIDDNLAIALCTYFDDHPKKPVGEEISDDTGWSPWVVERVNDVLDRVAAEATRLLEKGN